MSFKLYVSRSRDGLNWFDTQPIHGQHNTSATRPGVIVFQNKLWMIYRSYSARQLCVSKSTDGLSWTRPELIPKDTIDCMSGVALCVFEGALYMGYQDTRREHGGNLVSLVYSRNGVNWIKKGYDRAGHAEVTLAVFKERIRMTWCHDNNVDDVNWMGAHTNYCVHRGTLYQVWNTVNNHRLFISKSRDGVIWSHPFGLVGKTGWYPTLLSVNDDLILFYTRNSLKVMYMDPGDIVA